MSKQCSWLGPYWWWFAFKKWRLCKAYWEEAHMKIKLFWNVKEKKWESDSQTSETLFFSHSILYALLRLTIPTQYEDTIVFVHWFRCVMTQKWKSGVTSLAKCVSQVKEKSTEEICIRIQKPSNSSFCKNAWKYPDED